jgi:N-acetylglucosaminyldiphosphoundecaprenol N-acetyl-beta-D-mannosaminyltransferase
MKIVGTQSAPPRSFSYAEDREIIRTIELSFADVVWVGLSTPKQEFWMYEHVHKLRVPVVVGIGTAFDFHAVRTPRAPEWMRERWLEWCFRVGQRSNRSWRRYLMDGSEFAFRVAAEQFRHRSHPQ